MPNIYVFKYLQTIILFFLHQFLEADGLVTLEKNPGCISTLDVDCTSEPWVISVHNTADNKNGNDTEVCLIFTTDPLSWNEEQYIHVLIGFKHITGKNALFIIIGLYFTGNF